MRWRPGASSVTAALVLAVGGTVAPAAPAEAGWAVASDLNWGLCPTRESGSPILSDKPDPRQQCATLRVPLDYRRPSGTTIEISISRIPAARPAVRRGVLLTNPGGPGESGVDLPSGLVRTFPQAVLDRYDLIGFDPRGVGRSTPVTCGLPSGTAADLQMPYPAADGSIDRNVVFARNTAASCAERSGALLPFVTSANTARDMDRIRVALGEPRISYFGWSYGTYLGAVYASLFPQRTDRFILDSAVDPRLAWYEMWRTWNQGVALRFPDFARWLAARDGTFHLGTDAGGVTSAFLALAERLDRDPVPMSGSSTSMTGNLLREITRTQLYADGSFEILALVWSSLAEKRPAQPQTAGPEAAALPAAVADLVAGYQAMALPADNSYAALLAVTCDDVAWPRDIGRYTANATADRRTWPLTAGMPSNVWPCAYWQNQPVEPPVTVTDAGPRNVLILQNLRDPATPWRSGFGLRTALGHRAVMITVDAGGHGTYTLGSCADTMTDAYLVSGDLPATDQKCAGPVPDSPPPADDPAGPAAGPTAGPSATTGGVQAPARRPVLPGLPGVPPTVPR